MTEGLAGLANGVASNVQTALVPAVLLLMLVIGGVMYQLGNHQEGKRIITGSLIGTAIAIGANAIATAVRAVVHA